SVLGADGRPLKTREGSAASLEGLLDEAMGRARQVAAAVREEESQLGQPVSELPLEQIAEVVGIAAVKYADLSQNRTSDYRYSPDKMMLLNGNTATYMQYAYARNRSILRKGDVDVEQLRRNPPLPTLSQPEERALAVQLVRFEEALAAAAADYRPS